MTFQLLSYSVLHQPRYDNTHMLVIPSKVKHNKKKKEKKKMMVPRLILNPILFLILFLPDAELPSLEEINSITKGLPKKIEAAREK